MAGSAGPDLGTPTTLLLVRHATTAHTGRDFTGGAGDDEPLDDAGWLQAAFLARRLAGDVNGPDDSRMITTTDRALVASPTARTRQTPVVIGAALSLQLRRDDAWREIQALDDASVPELRSRVTRARDDLLARSPGGTVVVVTHAGPVKALVAGALDAGPAALWRLRIDPASVTTLRYWSDGGVEVAAVNDTSHLR